MAGRFPVKKMCNTLRVSRSGYYMHKKKPVSKRKLRDRDLKPKILQSYQRSRKTYGSPRIMQDLRKQGERTSKNRVARLMREQGIRAKCKRRYRPRTTQSDPKLAAAPNVLAKIPKPGAPNHVWVNDITYLPTQEGWLYLAVTMDLYSRRIVGWATSTSLETCLVTKSLERALATRGISPGLIHHSDRGCQYASHNYRDILSSTSEP
jgi:transposase InsO family protein